MGFMEAVRTVYRDKYATFSGRASRSEYWYSMLFVFLVMIAFIVVLALAGAVGDFASGGLSTVVGILLVIFGLFYLAILIPMISVAVRRLHDRNMSGWWYLGMMIGSAIPYVGFLISIAFLVIFCLKGTDGDNRFGRDPLKGAANAEVFS